MVNTDKASEKKDTSCLRQQVLLTCFLRLFILSISSPYVISSSSFVSAHLPGCESHFAFMASIRVVRKPPKPVDLIIIHIHHVGQCYVMTSEHIGMIGVPIIRYYKIRFKYRIALLLEAPARERFCLYM